VTDKRLGDLLFPARDAVMVPAISAAGSWELREGQWLDANISSGMTVVNVGANVGYFALWSAQLVGESGTVIAIEPDPTNFELLVQNIATHGYSRVVEPIRAAADHHSGILSLYNNPTNSGDHRVFDNEDSNHASIQIEAVAVDSLVQNRHVDAILTDAQGWDHRVLRGLRQTIERDRPVILSEFVPQWMSDQGEDPGSFLSEMVDLGYKIGVLEAGAAPGDWSMSEILEWVTPQRLFCNLELWPAEKPFRPHALLSPSFWRPESIAGGVTQWLTQPEGTIRLVGPVNSMVVINMTISPVPTSVPEVYLDGRAIVIRESTPVSLPVMLDGKGKGSLQISELSGPFRVAGDPRKLRVSVADLSVVCVTPDGEGWASLPNG
jgi:FkbM family methyltransferase